MSKPKVLIVDDLVIVREGTAFAIIGFGFDVDRAASVQEALRLVKATRYSAIIMDCYMPIIDGFECTRQIRALENASGRRVPIIGFSSGIDSELRQKCLTAGMDDFLDKDSSTAQMRAMLTKWISSGVDALP